MNAETERKALTLLEGEERSRESSQSVAEGLPQDSLMVRKQVEPGHSFSVGHFHLRVQTAEQD